MEKNGKRGLSISQFCGIMYSRNQRKLSKHWEASNESKERQYKFRLCAESFSVGNSDIFFYSNWQAKLINNSEKTTPLFLLRSHAQNAETFLVRGFFSYQINSKTIKESCNKEGREGV